MSLREKNRLFKQGFSMVSLGYVHVYCEYEDTVDSTVTYLIYNKFDLMAHARRRNMIFLFCGYTIKPTKNKFLEQMYDSFDR